MDLEAGNLDLTVIIIRHMEVASRLSPFVAEVRTAQPGQLLVTELQRAEAWEELKSEEGVGCRL